MPIGNAVIAGNADIAGNVPAATVRLLEKRSRARSETGKIGLSRRGRKNGADHFAAVPTPLARPAAAAVPGLLRRLPRRPAHTPAPPSKGTVDVTGRCPKELRLCERDA